MDEILSKEARNTVEALLRDKIRKILQEKLSENIESFRKLLKNWVYKTKRLPQ